MFKQISLIEEPLIITQQRTIKNLEEKYDRLRKSQHARITELNRELKDLKNKMDFLEAYICKGKYLL